jgi:tetratricopeptide (TPR) repeat protein
MALDVIDVRGIVERVCSRPEVLEACRKRDLGIVIEVLGTHGLTQGRMSSLTGIPQGRLSEYKHHKHIPQATSIFEDFANGLGMPPAARQALGLAPGRPAQADISTRTLDSQTPDVGLSYPDTPADAAENVSRLWRADLDNAPLLQARLDPGAWSDASLRWLVDPGHRPDSQRVHGVRIGLADVERFRTTVEMFQQLDDRFGGGHARQALVQYLSTDGDRLLRGRYTESIGRALFSATAEATLLAAWMSYDSAPTSSLAQRYFIQALALAQAGDDRLLGASVLDAMSHQATYTGRFADAANLARAAQAGTRGLATATLVSHFHTMEARALARLGDAKGCDRALAEAIREFERRRPENDPEWMQYFDESELSNELGHCSRDLGRSADAVEHARRMLAATDDTTFMRSDFFAMMVLADAHLAAGDAGQACAVALQALTAGEQIRSGRCIGYLREFRQRLTALGISRSADDFEEQAIRSRLWRIAAQPDKDIS